MSAVLASASPRRIKATHRRRRKITSGRFVQRYYDPQIGRFLSNDPVAANAGAGFNRYNYAYNNLYRFTDPDGRMPAADAKEKREAAKQRREAREARHREQNSDRVTYRTSAGTHAPAPGATSSIDWNGAQAVGGGVATTQQALGQGLEVVGKFEKLDEMAKYGKGLGKFAGAGGIGFGLAEAGSAETLADFGHGLLFAGLSTLEVAQPETAVVILPIQLMDLYVQTQQFPVQGQLIPGWSGLVQAANPGWNQSIGRDWP